MLALIAVYFSRQNPCAAAGAVALFQPGSCWTVTVVGWPCKVVQPLPGTPGLVLHGVKISHL